MKGKTTYPNSSDGYAPPAASRKKDHPTGDPRGLFSSNGNDIAYTVDSLTNRYRKVAGAKLCLRCRRQPHKRPTRL